MRYNIVFILFLLGCWSCNGSENTSPQASKNKEKVSSAMLNTLSPAEISAGWTLLFDGESTQGWRGFKSDSFPSVGWHVTDGCLMIEYSGTGEKGFAGDLITTGTYKNFDLKLEWKISPGGNSGILFNVTESGDDVTWHSAMEIQVLDEFGYDDIHDYVPDLRQISGALYDLYTPFCAASRPVGEWNEARILLENGHIRHWLNDRLVVDAELWTDDWENRVAKSKFSIYPDYGMSREGHIGLQDHGQQVWFRNIKILELE